MAQLVKPKRASRAAELKLWRSRQPDENGLLPFQSAFVAAVSRKEKPAGVLALSVPRGNGKSWLSGGLVARSLTPGDPLFEAGVENILVSSSTNQARIVLEFARQALGEVEGYRWRNDGVTHLKSRARVRIVSSDARRALGLGANVRLIVADEPGAWSPIQGRRLWDAMSTSLGKRRTQIIIVGTLAPAPLTGPASWWPSLVAEGSGEGRHVALLQADGDKWRDFGEVLRVNPVCAVNPYLRETLELEHAAALKSENAARTYRQFRCNIPGDPVEARVFSAAELMTVCARPAPPREGVPILSVDTGGLLSWSSACAIWPSGRIELWAISGPGSTATLTESDGLFVGRAEVPPVEAILSRVADFPEPPSLVVGDPHRFAELQQWARARGIRCALRGGRSSNLVGDVQAARRLLLDAGAAFALGGPLIQMAAGQVSLTGDGRGLRKTGGGHDDPLRAFLICAGAAAPQAAPLAGVVYVEPPAW